MFRRVNCGESQESSRQIVISLSRACLAGEVCTAVRRRQSLNFQDTSTQQPHNRRHDLPRQTLEKAQEIFERGERLTKMADSGKTVQQAADAEGVELSTASMAISRHRKRLAIKGIVTVQGQILETDKAIFDELTAWAADKVRALKGES